MENKHTSCVKILLINERTYPASTLLAVLNSEGYDVYCAHSLSDAVLQLNSHIFDVVLTGIVLNDGNGYSLCRHIKENFQTPVIFISSKQSEADIVSAFEVGADDFITVPFRHRELICRINNVLKKRTVSNTILTFKNIKIDTVKGLVTKDGKEIYLSSLEYRILLVFMSNQGKILSRENLLEAIWADDGSYINDNTLTVYIKRIREKLEDKPSTPRFIKTVRGKGYRTGE